MSEGSLNEIEEVSADDVLCLIGKHSDPGKKKEMIVALHRSLSHCNDELIKKCLVDNSEFWDNIFSDQEEPIYDEETAEAINFLIYRTTSVHLRSENSHALEHFCSLISSNLVESLMKYTLSERGDWDFIASVIETVTNYLVCLLRLDDLNVKASTPLISGACLLLSADGFILALEPFLNNAQDERVHELVVTKLIPTYSKLNDRLSSRKAGKFTGPVGAQLSELMDKFFKLDDCARQKFLAANEQYCDFSNLSLQNTIDLVLFLGNGNLSFRKKFTERLLFEDDAFPVVLALVLVSNELHQFYNEELCREASNKDSVMQCVLYNEVLIFASMNKLLELWIASQAQDTTDLKSLLKLLSIAIFQSEPPLGSTQGSVHMCLQNLKLMSYSSLRKLQLTKIRKSHYKKWSKQVSHFDSMLSNHVLEFVRHQRLLLLQKGAWVYSENPLDNNVKHPKVYFLVLSDNQMNLLAKEYKNRSEENPAVQGNEIITVYDGSVSKSKTTVIPLKKIAHLQHWRVQAENKVPQDAKLINILNKTVYTEIQIFDKDSSRLLKFYLDTKEASYIWLDGLQLVASTSASKKVAISKDTKSQIDTLVDLRKNVQMIGLDDHDDLDMADLDSESEEQYYDLNTLQSITTNFHYE